MLSRSFDDIADVVLNRKQVYSLDVDARLRDAADRLSARAFFELLSRLDDRKASFGETLGDLCRDVFKEETYVIGFGERIENTAESDVVPEDPVCGAVHYLRMVFVNADAAYYQYPLFPNMDRDYIVGGARKRAGDCQYVRLELTEGRFLQTFIEECRQNPHFVRVEECSEKEFWAAPSNGV
jgi:hypothetical protein